MVPRKDPKHEEYLTRLRAIEDLVYDLFQDVTEVMYPSVARNVLIKDLRMAIRASLEDGELRDFFKEYR